MDGGSGRGPGDDSVRLAGDGVPGADGKTIVETGPSAADGHAAPATVLAPGERYVVTRRLGEGGTAVVYEARDVALERTVALKVLRREHLVFAEHRARFADEARIMGALEHPGTVPVYDAGEMAGGEPFYTMKRVQGPTLRALLTGRSAADVRSRHDLVHFVDIFEHICEAVAAAHAVGLVHRDLKPENVMTDEFGAVYVMDWGLAKRVDEPEAVRDHRTQLGAVMGTPAYMPPEQVRGLARESGREADVFSLGVILYEILTGALPFSGATYREITDKVLNEDPVDVRRRNPRAPRQLAAVCTKALDKNPGRRYPDAGALADDVRRYREFLPVSAARPSATDRVIGWSRRRPMWAAAAAAVVLAGLMTASILGYQAAVERQVLARGLARIEELRLDLDRADQSIEALQQALDNEATGEAERRSLQQQLQQMQTRRRLDEALFKSTVSGLMGFTWMASDEQVQALAKQQVLDSVRRRISDRQYATARTSIRWLLASDAHDNPFALTDADRRELRNLLAEATRGLEETRAERRGAAPAPSGAPAAPAGSGSATAPR
jgi:tRNA A-37 threonylcarbamoyl transferase component Bud32